VVPTLEISPHVDGVGMKLIGEVDLATAPQLREALAERGASDVVLDLSELTFMDSSGLGVLLTFAGSRNGHGPVVLLDSPPSIERLFAIVRLEEHPNVELRRSDGA
jgi:anti-sigma B factor antagonist